MMRKILSFIVAMITGFIVFVEMLILLLPLLILLFITGKDYSRRWMIEWADEILVKCKEVWYE